MFWNFPPGHQDQPALVIEGGAVLSYHDLALHADALADAGRRCLAEAVSRPLVLIHTRNALEPILAYLAALRAGWPVILVAEEGGAGGGGSLPESPPDQRILDTYRPNLVYRCGAQGWAWLAADATQADLHPQLALLLSTSGSTGAPKLVRLSQRNIAANAASIADYLGIRSDDRAITTLPWHYSYGLSVLNSYLLRGACLILSDASLVEPAFWQAAQQHGASSLALVPSQFQLLDAGGAALASLPRLRYITQAGGRLDEDLVRRFAALGRAQGWQLFVMYGQTEAAPRMAYVPPQLLADNPGCIGLPIPGGRLSLIDAEGREIDAAQVAGELVYEGPNVMLGYAESRQALAAPAGPARLPTGDIAERQANGLFRIVGRASRFLKLAGLRLSLDDIERTLAAQGQRVLCTGHDDLLTVFLVGHASPEQLWQLRQFLIHRYALTGRLVRTAPLAEPPLLPTGKIDYGQLAHLAQLARQAEIAAGAAAEARPDMHPDARRAAAMAGNPGSPGGLRQALAAVLCDALRTRQVDLRRSFRELGGDSLAFLDVQLWLEQRLGQVPEGWESRPLQDLCALVRQPAAFWQPLALDVLGRVLATLAIIAQHVADYPTGGGTLLLIVLMGWSLARFQSIPLTQGRVGPVLRSMLLPLVAGYYLCIAGTALLWKPVELPWFLLLGNFERPVNSGALATYWFVSLYVQVMLLMCLPFLLPPVRQRVARQPLGCAVAGVLLLTLCWQALQWQAPLPDKRFQDPLIAIGLVLLGWCIYFAPTRRDKALVSALYIAHVLAFWWLSLSAALLLLGGGLGLLWGRPLRLPAPLVRACTFVAQRALFIYLTHGICLALATRLFDGAERGLAMLLLVAGASIGTGHLAKTLYDRAGHALRQGRGPAQRHHSSGP